MLYAVCDGAKTKVGKYIPGVGIPIITLNEAKNKKIDIIIIFAWNYFEEIKKLIENFFKSINKNCPLILSSRDRIFFDE